MNIIYEPSPVMSVCKHEDLVIMVAHVNNELITRQCYKRILVLQYWAAKAC